MSEVISRKADMVNNARIPASNPARMYALMYVRIAQIARIPTRIARIARIARMHTLKTQRKATDEPINRGENTKMIID